VTLAGGVVGLLWLIRRGANDCPIVVAAAIGDGRAVVACRSSYRDHVKPDLSLWVISLEDGRALRRVAIDRGHNEWVTFIGRQKDWLWIRIGNHGLRAYGLPDAARARVLDGALARHPVLSRGMTNNAWVSAGGAVLQGNDLRDYAVTVDGTIRRFEGTGRDRWSTRDVGDPGDGLTVVARADGGTLLPDADALVQPRILVDGGAPLWIDGGRGVLAASVDVVTPDGNDRLSRLDLSGKPVWTVTTEQIMRAAGAGNRRGCKLRDVHAPDRTIWATIVCIGYSRYGDGRRTMNVVSRLVAIDPADGKTLRALRPHVAD
jgi:hypothetical protein